MTRAERKHLLGDHQAGGAFAATRWITMAVAAVVLLAAGAGIIAISMLQNPDRAEPPSIAVAPESPEDSSSGNAGGSNYKGGIPAGKGSGPGLANGTINGGSSRDLKATGGKLVIADEAFDYAVANATSTSIYTHNVSDTVAVLEKSLTRNDVLPLELEPPARASNSKAGHKSKAVQPEARNVSRGTLNFYYNKKQDPEQVQIVVLASDAVINQLNGDLATIAETQLVSQAPAPGGEGTLAKDGRSGKRVARRAGIQGRDDNGYEDTTGQTLTIAGGTGQTKPDLDQDAPARPKAVQGTPAGGQSDRKTATVDPSDPTVGQPAVRAKGTDADTTQPKKPGPTDVARKPGPADTEDVTAEGQGGAPPVTTAKTGRPQPKGGTVDKKNEAGDTSKLLAAQGPTTRPAGPGQLDVQLAEVLEANTPRQRSRNYDIAAALSKQIAIEQQRGRQDKEIQKKYAELNNMFRQNILADELRHKVQSQKEQGANIQALVININRRSLRSSDSAETKDIRARGAGDYLRQRATTTSAPAPKPTTQRTARQAEASTE